MFATVLATGALIGIEAASGLAGEVRVGRRGLRRVVIVVSSAALLLMTGVSAAALMALPVQNGATELGGRFVEAPVLGMVSTLDPQWLRDAFRYSVGALAGGHPPHRDERPDARRGPAVLLAGHEPPDPERRGAASSEARHALRGHHHRRRSGLRAGAPARRELPRRDLRLRGHDHVRDRARVGDRPALPRGGTAERVPGPALGASSAGAAFPCRPRSAPCSPPAPG